MNKGKYDNSTREWWDRTRHSIRSPPVPMRTYTHEHTRKITNTNTQALQHTYMAGRYMPQHTLSTRAYAYIYMSTYMRIYTQRTRYSTHTWQDDTRHSIRSPPVSACMRACVRMSMYTYAHTHTNASANTHTLIYINTHTHAHKSQHKQMVGEHTALQAPYTRACVCVCMTYAYMQTVHTHLHIYTHTHTPRKHTPKHTHTHYHCQ